MTEPEYELVVTRRVPNPEYGPTDRYGPEKPMYLESRMLIVAVTTKEYDAIRKATLEAFA